MVQNVIHKDVGDFKILFSSELIILAVYEHIFIPPSETGIMVAAAAAGTVQTGVSTGRPARRRREESGTTEAFASTSGQSR